MKSREIIERGLEQARTVLAHSSNLRNDQYCALAMQAAQTLLLKQIAEQLDWLSEKIPLNIGDCE